MLMAKSDYLTFDFLWVTKLVVRAGSVAAAFESLVERAEAYQ